MSALCVFCNFQKATQHCNLCKKGFTCSQKTCTISFEFAHICGKRSREEGGDEEDKAPWMLEELVAKYKAIVIPLVSHLDSWEDVWNMCNVNARMRTICTEFNQHSGGIWQYLLQWCYPFKTFPKTVRKLRDARWPTWAREHPYVYFQAFLLAVYLKYGRLLDKESGYFDHWEKVIHELHNGPCCMADQLRSLALTGRDENLILTIYPSVTEKIEEDEDRDEDEQEETSEIISYWMYFYMDIDFPEDDETGLQHDYNENVKEQFKDFVRLTNTIDEKGFIQDNAGISLKMLIKFFYRVWIVHGFRWGTMFDIPQY
jgi:hypothetical protein